MIFLVCLRSVLSPFSAFAVAAKCAATDVKSSKAALYRTVVAPQLSQLAWWSTLHMGSSHRLLLGKWLGRLATVVLPCSTGILQMCSPLCPVVHR